MRKLFGILLAPLLGLGQPVDAATLRTTTTLVAPVVRLSDLFDELGPEGARVLGPGPAPGGRIVVESAQLAAIARQFGVEWRPNGSNERAILERPGKLLPRDDVMSALRAALVGVGAPSDGDLELPGYAPPLVPAETPARADIEQLEYEGATGRFTATLSVSGDGMLTQRQRLAGTMHEIAEVPVLTRRLPPGATITAADLTTARLRAAQIRGDVVRMPSQALGMAIRRQLPAGQAVPLADIGRAIAVAKGARVLMQLSTPGLTVATMGQALEAGAIGERIQVLNPSSRAVLEVEVIGPDRVRVAPGSSPVLASTQPRQPSGFAPNSYAQVVSR